MMFAKLTVSLALSVCLSLQVSAETIFSDYFDIPTNANAGSKVLGKVNIKSNKTAHLNQASTTYQFDIIGLNNTPFKIDTITDHKGRIFGQLTVKEGKKTPELACNYQLTVALKDGDKTLTTQQITINVVQQTLWQSMQSYYADVSLGESHLWGRKKFSQQQTADYIEQLLSNDGQFADTKIYGPNPHLNYSANQQGGSIELSAEERAQAKKVKWEVDLIDTAKTIGGLGRMYAIDAKYKQDPKLKKALYKAITAFANAIPVYPEDFLVDGKPLGKHLGDGFALLHQAPIKAMSWSLLTHQWDLSEALVVPAVHLAPQMLADIDNGDHDAKAAHDALLRVFQTHFAIVEPRRAMDDPNQRWGQIASSTSQGAWSDANIGHRIRSLFALPIIFADYNRPMTYVPYWYDDFYDGTPFEGKTFAKNWSPRGVVQDLHHWSNLFSIPSKQFIQSGFNPDGTASHHLGSAEKNGAGSDLAMTSYGYEWMMKVRYATGLFKDTAIPLKDENYQFVIDRYNYAYQAMIYKGAIDFVTAGRSSMDDQTRWVNRNLARDLGILLANKAPSTKVYNEQQAIDFAQRAKKGINRYSTTRAFFNGDYLVHRRQDDDNDFFYSLKFKSNRTMGAEDFSSVRKTWHLGAGVLQLKVDGSEYRQDVRLNWDFHAVPGVTEEWRNTPFPQKGGSYAAGSGLNSLSSVSSDGEYALGFYQHKPKAPYNTANANKSYFFSGNRAIAFGDGVKRVAKGDDQAIITTIEQAEQREPIFFNIDGEKSFLEFGHHNKTFTVSKPSWVYHKQKGYLIIPNKPQQLFVKTGSQINTTDPKPEKLDQLRRRESSYFSNPHNFLLALDHGENPTGKKEDSYHYVMLANISQDEMDAALQQYLKDVTVKQQLGHYHAIIDNAQQLVQLTTMQATKVNLGKQGKISTDAAALVQYADKGSHYQITISDPNHDVNLSELNISLPIPLQAGNYQYQVAGIHTFAGENVHIVNKGKSSFVKIELPDLKDSIYQGKARLYAGAPIVITVPKG
ncbi:polysaccharide lyase family 8 super-sandwich domain-containing protein [Paraferrimonas sp. SM1919]|uniref:polysaccharide lyase family 8 super-sandwich domain-containing protein n=1 Tax=Paraferrimonas sp. SM1919 TaxID=2662263 RepID=UPI0013CFDADA|nr:polysaccharide lyase family 8 super-sandwich domain-containing protein [Paraferrimonas sp. SM1919]